MREEPTLDAGEIRETEDPDPTPDGCCTATCGHGRRPRQQARGIVVRRLERLAVGEVELERVARLERHLEAMAHEQSLDVFTGRQSGAGKLLEAPTEHDPESAHAEHGIEAGRSPTSLPVQALKEPGTGLRTQQASPLEPAFASREPGRELEPTERPNVPGRPGARARGSVPGPARAQHSGPPEPVDATRAGAHRARRGAPLGVRGAAARARSASECSTASPDSRTPGRAPGGREESSQRAARRSSPASASRTSAIGTACGRPSRSPT